MEEIDILIIGAGVVGLAIAGEVAEKEKNVVVLEKSSTFGQETSSRNSEVIHAGMHYPAGTLKAELCVKGSGLLYEICAKFNIPHKKTGKLTVALQKSEESLLEDLLARGKNNGVRGLEIYSSRKLRDVEPNIKALAALYSPATGIIDSHALMQYFVNRSKDNGAMIAYGSEVSGIEKTNNFYNVSIKSGKDLTRVKAKIVINSAGLDADLIAAMAGLDIKKLKYELHYCKGQYFRVRANKSKFIKRLIYPVPNSKSAGLGIHATPDLGGGLRLGPDDEYMRTREKDYSTDALRRSDFYKSTKEFMPFIEEEDLSPDTSGIRPKLQGPGEDFRDFIIKDESENGLRGFINLIGIESPGLTASPAIAGYVKKIIECL